MDDFEPISTDEGNIPVITITLAEYDKLCMIRTRYDLLRCALQSAVDSAAETKRNLQSLIKHLLNESEE